MMRIRIGELFLRTLLVFVLISVTMEFDVEENYLIDCGSFDDTSVDDGRVFMADSLNSSVLSTSERVFVNTSSNSIPSATGLANLYRTARIFNGVSQYKLSVKNKGWHWIRLYFFPFSSSNGSKFNLTTARFSVSAQNFTLLKDFQPSISVPVVKEFSVNVPTDIENLVLKFTPSEDSFAFLNALEIISLPDELIPVSVKTVGSHGRNQNLEVSQQALETVVRVNMGNETVFPRNDTLSRLWLSDREYLTNPDLVEFVSDVSLVNFTKGRGGGEEEASDKIGSSLVYGTGTTLRSKWDPNTQINVTWLFNVDSGFEYFVRFHFCNILKQAVLKNFFFNVFLNSDFAAKDLNLSTVGVPEYKDVIVRPNNGPQIRISIGPSTVLNAYPDGILNGLEIMKISNSRNSLAAADAEIQPSKTSTSSKFKVWMIVCLAVGLSMILVVSAFVFILITRRRNRALIATHSTPEHDAKYEQNSVQNKYYEGESSIFSRSKIGYRFPFVAVQEATGNFSESLIIGVGGFGKVYKGVLRDGTIVAVKRGVPQSSQGLSEFKTEIEMLSQFRHRHLVSLIGYCDEKNEMIIIYEFMEKGTLKDHLYGSSSAANHPKLNWRQRLEICIGSARGLHYLHTGSAKPIIHRDVKSANILLDENIMAKVADFGLSKTGPDIDQTHVSTAVKGSFGYLDPEYLTMQQLTEKSDVYSFGVVMFEVLGGRPVIDPSQPKEKVNLLEWAMKCSERNELENFVDSYIVNEIRPESLMKFKETAEKCLAERGADRSTMGDVLWNLECALQIQLQGEYSGHENNHQEISSVTAMEISMGSLGDLAGVSMSKVFSDLVKAEPI